MSIKVDCRQSCSLEEQQLPEKEVDIEKIYELKGVRLSSQIFFDYLPGFFALSLAEYV